MNDAEQLFADILQRAMAVLQMIGTRPGPYPGTHRALLTISSFACAVMHSSMPPDTTAPDTLHTFLHPYRGRTARVTRFGDHILGHCPVAPDGQKAILVRKVACSDPYRANPVAHNLSA